MADTGASSRLAAERHAAAQAAEKARLAAILKPKTGGYAGALGGNNFRISKDGLGTPQAASQKIASMQGTGKSVSNYGGGSGPSPAMSALTSMMSSAMSASAAPPQPAAMPAPPPPAPLRLTANADPGMSAYLASLAGRTQQQQAKENAPVSWSAERATDLANRDIFGGAAGAKKRKLEELSERGLSPGAGVGAGQLRAIDEAALTRSARAASDIGLAREKEQDALNLQREGATNALYGQLGNFAQVPFQQQLAGQRLGLDAWQAQDRSTLERAGLAQRANESSANLAAANQDRQMNTWLSLMRSLQ